MQWQKNFMQENQNISLGYNLFMSTQVDLNCMQVMDRKQQCPACQQWTNVKSQKAATLNPPNLSVRD